MRGSLGVFNLLDLLQLLSQNQSKGCLTVFHPTEREGKVFFESGKITHVSFGNVQDIDALRAMLKDERGNFEFLPTKSPPQKTITQAFDNLMLEVIRTLDETTSTVEKKIPPPGELDSPKILDMTRLSALTLAADEFAIVQLIDGERTVVSISQATGQPLEAVQKTLVRLSSMGLLEVKKRQPRVARLVIGLSRELVDMRVCVDDVILRAWDRQHGRPVRRVRMRDDGGREFIFDAMGAPNIGAYALFSNNALMRFDLRAGGQVLLKPEG
jgi:Domain of unknown function (DUF4388)